MKQLIIVCALSAMLVLSACVRIDATAEDYPHLLRRPIDANAIAVGISMKLKVLFGSLSPTLYTGPILFDSKRRKIS
jgi:hypothetical protein